MMMLEATIGVFSLSLLWAFLCGPYRDYRDDLLRQRLFELRDRLFDLAASGRLQFTHPAYGMLRTLLNGYLFSAERVSLLQFVLFERITKKDESLMAMEQQFRTGLSDALSTIPEGVRGELVAIREQASVLLIQHVVMTSPVFWAMVLPVLFVAIISVLGTAVASPVRQWLAGGSQAETFEAMGVAVAEVEDATLAPA
jgi:uncharacterized membrane protein YwzB